MCESHKTLGYVRYDMVHDLESQSEKAPLRANHKLSPASFRSAWQKWCSVRTLKVLTVALVVLMVVAVPRGTLHGRRLATKPSGHVDIHSEQSLNLWIEYYEADRKELQAELEKLER